MEKYLFIDRDGTLVAEPEDEQVDSLEKIVFEPEVIPALRKLADYGYTLIMVSNQDGLGTSSFPQEDFETAQNFIVNTLSSQGVTFREILICPHFPHEGCHCRKPQTGLVEKYLRRTDWDRKNSYVIGDRDTDVKLAENMGIGSFKYHRTDLCWMDIADKIIRKDRTAHVIRNTRETQIDLYVNLDHPQGSSISTGIGFFDHMLDQIATHGNFQLVLKVKGDLEVDEHHTVEDVGIALGTALREALGDKRGIVRFAFALPMDELYAKIEGFSTSLLNETPSAVLDISGRPFASFICDAEFMRSEVGGMATEMVPHFFRSLADAMGITLHLFVSQGNTHHQVEALFKSFGRALRQAVKKEGSALPSSKGVL
ncbi:MAG: bifunctional histidinol-phosphatase/imidazoleglycerol-phosphate dehydratase HisB [Succinivibrionaceae bacterium]